jgi:hypothetical protein
MGTFNIVLDRRTKLKEDRYNLAIRMVNGNDVMNDKKTLFTKYFAKSVIFYSFLRIIKKLKNTQGGKG